MTNFIRLYGMVTLNDEIKNMCKSLRPAYVAEIYETITFDNKQQFLHDLFKTELDLREKARAQRLIKRARIISHKTLETYQWNNNIHFTTQINQEILTSLKFTEKRENVILTRSLGTGKSHLADTLGRASCKNECVVRLYRVSDLVDELERAQRERRFQQFRNKFKKGELIILDEMGYIPFGKEGA